MLVKISSPFKIVLRISEEIELDPDEVSLKQLRDVVAGRDTTFPRSQAIALLLASDFPNKHRDFEALLVNEEESPRIRYIAALSLGTMNTPRALEILIKNSQTRDERTLAGVMMALGRIGDKAALEAVSRASEHATGLAASQAKFAAALISHRLGLRGNELPVPKNRDFLQLPRGAARPFQIARAHHTDAEFCLRSLGAQPFGIEFAESPMYQIRCGRRVLMVLFNRDFTGQDVTQRLRERKAFPGVVAVRSVENGLYSVVYLLLTSPASQPDAVSVLIHRSTGEPIFGGTAQVKGNQAEFSIHTVSRPGAFASQIEGIFEDGRLEMKTALSAVFTQKKRQPIKGLRPESVE